MTAKSRAAIDDSNRQLLATVGRFADATRDFKHQMQRIEASVGTKRFYNEMHPRSRHTSQIPRI